MNILVSNGICQLPDIIPRIISEMWCRDYRLCRFMGRERASAVAYPDLVSQLISAPGSA